MGSETARDRVRTVAIRLIMDGKEVGRGALREAGCRYSDELLGHLLAELIEDGTVKPENLNVRHPVRRGTFANSRVRRTLGGLPVKYRCDSREEERVELPTLRQHAPDAPWLAPAPTEVSLWEWLAAKYWAAVPRAWYRGATS